MPRRHENEQQHLWDNVDAYIATHLLPRDPALEQALSDSDAAGMPAIHVAPNQGKLLHLLARLRGARHILEIGTLAGYSTIWLARALPADGRVVTIELNPKHADVARRNLQRAAVAERVELRVGRALDELPQLVAEKRPPFDFVFIDADKQNIPEYVDWSLQLTARGSVIVVDNVIRDGGVIDPSGDDAVQGVRRMFDALSRETRLDATSIQIVGSKGYDGIVLGVVA